MADEQLQRALRYLMAGGISALPQEDRISLFQKIIETSENKTFSLSLLYHAETFIKSNEKLLSTRSNVSFTCGYFSSNTEQLKAYLDNSLVAADFLGRFHLMKYFEGFEGSHTRTVFFCGRHTVRRKFVLAENHEICPECLESDFDAKVYT